MTIIAPRGRGPSVRNPVGGPIEFKATAEQTGGALSAFETVAAAGEGPPLHVHADEDETLYFLEGAFRVRIDDEVHAAPAGTFVFLPRGVVHTWQNVGDGDGRLLALFTPAAAGMERFFVAFAETPGEASAAFADLAPLAGMTVAGPPLARSHPV